MHSRIYEVSTENIKEGLDIGEFWIRYLWFENIADYVISSESTIEEDIDWLCSFLDIKKEKNKIYLSKETAKKYMKLKYENFKESSQSFEQFMDCFLVNRIQEFLNDEYGFYMIYEDTLMTLDEFLRNIIHENKNEVYYIGAIFDYHF